ncbi:MAG: penicillin-binding protein 2 [Dehalococcoidia bacterium]|nr:penicillin-binding protein 2 [Dehalococcoidia bacterium]
MSNEISRLTWRHKTLFSIVVLLTGILLFRLFSIQVINHNKYKEEAYLMHSSVQKLTANRGTIYDRNFFPLATSLQTWDIFIDSSKINTANQTNEIQELCAFLLINCDEILYKALNGSEQILVQRKIPYSKYSIINKKNSDAIYALNSSKRIYPEKNLAGQVIGYLGLDEKGLWGIERDFNDILSGTAGSIYFETDPFGRPITFGNQVITEPQAGKDIVLTIDKYIQNYSQKYLLEALKDFKAESGSILVMDPNNGEVLAMANYPEIELENNILLSENLSDNVRNKIISDIYEPGSVMKLINTAIGFDLGVVAPETTYIDKGFVDIGPQRIQNWDLNTYGETSIKNHLIHSLNTGAVWIAQKVGPERFYKYLDNFGFGDLTSIGLSGEAEGLLRTNKSKDWYPIDLATNSYGQGIAATPLQVLTAVNVLINDGKLIRPKIIKEIANETHVNNSIFMNDDQVIKQKTSQNMKEMMLAIVEESIYHQAKIDGFLVAGKTGTTINTINAVYDWDYTIATFAGFVPYENPKISILIKIDYPRGNKNLGGEIAAPTFSKLASEILEYLQIAPSKEMVKN